MKKIALLVIVVVLLLAGGLWLHARDTKTAGAKLPVAASAKATIITPVQQKQAADCSPNHLATLSAVPAACK